MQLLNCLYSHVKKKSEIEWEFGFVEKSERNYTVLKVFHEVGREDENVELARRNLS